jgi:hypothetical protein
LLLARILHQWRVLVIHLETLLWFMLYSMKHAQQRKFKASLHPCVHMYLAPIGSDGIDPSSLTWRLPEVCIFVLQEFTTGLSQMPLALDSDRKKPITKARQVSV